MSQLVRKIRCENCGLEGHIPENVTTPFVRCPKCGTRVTNPDAGAAPEPQHPPTLQHQHHNGGHSGHLLDEFFARMSDGGALPAAPVTFSTTVERVGPPPPPPAAMPTGPLSAGSDAERNWLQEERQRLEGYMQKHFGLLQQQREEFAGWRTQVEAALISREQELNRQAQQIKNHVDQCNEQAAQLDQRGAELAQQAADIEDRRARVEEETRLALQEEMTRLEQFHGQANELLQVLEAARAEYATLDASLSEHRQRAAALEAVEQELRKREERLQANEAMLYNELEKQEQRLGLERRQIAQARRDLENANQDRALRRLQLSALERDVAQLRAQLATALQHGRR